MHLLIRVSFLFCFILFTRYSTAQSKQITGKVTDSLQKPIPFANVMAYNIQDKDTIMLTFTQTNESGEFKLSVASSIQTLTLRVSMLGYAEVWQTVTPTSDNYTLPKPIRLLSSAIQFQDVFVVDKKTFNASGDTLTINANAFKDSTEKNIEDLLKKIPGFSVGEKGEIKYKEKTISRITIEGEDITKKNYQIISRNFSARPVEDIQVIQNYSDNPLLAGVPGQDKETVLNLKLNEKYKNIWNASIDLYAAYPFLYDLNGNINMISKKLKTINFIDAGTISRNNSNINLDPFSPQNTDATNNLATSINYTSINLYQDPITDIESFLYQNYQNYRINTSANYKINPKTTLKWTAHWNTYDKNFTEQQNEYNFAAFITGNRKLSQNQKMPFGDIEISYFPNKKHFFTHTSTYNYTQNTETENQNTNIFNYQANAYTNRTIHTHKTSYTHKTNKYTFRHQVQYAHFEQETSFNLYQSPAKKFPIIDTLADTIQENKFVPVDNLHYQTDIFTKKMRYTIEYHHLFQSLQSNIQSLPYSLPQNNLFTNQSKYRLQKACFSTYKEIKIKYFTLFAQLKPCFMQWKYISYNNLPATNTVFTLLPSIRVSYKGLGLGYQYQLYPQEWYNLYSGYVFRSTRSLYGGTNLIYPTHNHSIILFMNYNNYSKGIMTYNSISYGIQKGLFGNYLQIDSTYTLSKIYSEQITVPQITVYSMFSKIFYEHRWGIGATIFGFQNQTQNFFYGIPITAAQRLISAHINVYLLPRKVFNFSIGLTTQYTQVYNRFLDLPVKITTETYQIFPKSEAYVRYKKWKFFTKILYFLNYNNYFNTPFLLPWTQLECTYTLPYKNASLSLQCENLFNHTKWQTNTISSFSNQQNFIPLRGRVFLLNFAYSF